MKTPHTVQENTHQKRRSKMHLVVLGGGQAGLGTAVALSKRRPKDIDLKITLIDPKDFFETRWASVRAFFDESVRQKMLASYDDLCEKRDIVHVRRKAMKLSKTAVTLDNDEVINFDVCLIAVGAQCPTKGVDPSVTTMSDRRDELVKTGGQLLAQNVVVIGGGALGVEVAGELARPLRDSGHNVTLLHKGHMLVPQMREAGGKLTEKKLKELGVDVRLNSPAQKLDDDKWKIENSNEETESTFDSNLTVDCTGYRANNGFMMDGELSESLDEKGWIKTNEFCQVEASDGRIFAFGDCCTTGQKRVTSIFLNTSTIVHNIKCALALLSEETKQAKHLRKFNNPPNITVVTLGKTLGVTDTPLGAFTAFLPWIKNNDMFVARGMSYVQ